MIIRTLKENFKSGCTVSLISIPLSVSLAVASNASPLIGIITAIWAGLIAALLGGSHFNIVGPTGALSGIIAIYVATHGLQSLPLIAILSGLMIFFAFILKLERYLILIPSSVIHGFTLGVAFIIGLGQLNFALGLSDLAHHEKFFFNFLETLRHLQNFSPMIFGTFLIFLLGLFAFKKWTPKLPGAIILAPVGILLGYFSQNQTIPFSLPTLGSKFGDIQFKLFQFPDYKFSTGMIRTSLVVALVAILETLLSAKIADGMTRTKHDERKEMLGLGLANIVCGLMGGMPATAALARTSLNIKTGATHWTSAVINVAGIVVISGIFLQYFKYIPLCVIAAILVFVAFQMVEAEHFAKFWKYERSGFFVSLFVAAITIVEDPILGILLGAAVSLLLFVNRISQGHFDYRVNRFQGHVSDGEKITEDGDILLYSIRGKLCYINSRAHITRFENDLRQYRHIILRLREIYFMDSDGIEALDEIVNTIESRGQQAIFTSIDPTILGLLEQTSDAYCRLKEKKLIFQKSEQALQFLGSSRPSAKELVKESEKESAEK